MPSVEIAFQFICNNNVETLCLCCSLPDKFRGTVVKMVTQAKREVHQEPSYFQCDEQLGNYITYLLQNQHLLTFKSPTSSQSVSSGASASVGGGGVASRKDYLHSFSPTQQLPAPIQVRMRRPILGSASMTHRSETASSVGSDSSSRGFGPIGKERKEK